MTLRQAIAQARRAMRRRGGVIRIWTTPPRKQIVKPPRRHDPSTHDCRGGVTGDRFPL